MTLTTPTAEPGRAETAEVALGSAGDLKPIPLSPEARERLKVLNNALKTAGRSANEDGESKIVPPTDDLQAK